MLLAGIRKKQQQQKCKSLKANSLLLQGLAAIAAWQAIVWGYF
jgi:hypothetical protein